jgi:hypothetical protein
MHMMLSIPPKYAASRVVGYIKLKLWRWSATITGSAKGMGPR